MSVPLFASPKRVRRDRHPQPIRGSWLNGTYPSLMRQVRLILICGLPGPGKTTLAKKLAAEAQAVRLSPDEWKHALGIDYYDEAARVRLENRLWLLAQELLTLGQSVVMEHGFWAREERDELRAVGRKLGATVELHYLEASVEELWRRLQVRNQE